MNITSLVHYLELSQNSIHELEIKDLTQDAIDILKTYNFLYVNQRIYRANIKIVKDIPHTEVQSPLKPMIKHGMIGGEINKRVIEVLMNNPIFKFYVIIVVILLIILVLHVVKYVYQLFKIRSLKKKRTSLINSIKK